MKHQAFRSKALKRLLEYNVAKQFPKGGKYRGEEFEHILLDRKDNVINQGLQNSLCGLLRKKWHAYSTHLNSSQALAVNLLGPLCLKMRWSAILGTGHKAPKIDEEQNIKCEFEYRDKQVGDDDGTEFDFYLSDGVFKVYFEVKYTERTLRTRSKAKDDGKERLWSLHSSAFQEIVAGELTKDDFFDQYQLWRNILKIANDNSYVYFIIPEKREDLKKEINEAKDILKDEYKEKVRIRYIEKICAEVDCRDNDLKKHYEEFKNKYIF